MKPVKQPDGAYIYRGFKIVKTFSAKGNHDGWRLVNVSNDHLKGKNIQVGAFNLKHAASAIDRTLERHAVPPAE